MLKTVLTHPQILEALAAAGHGSLVLISDGNFPSLTAPYPGARRVYLNLGPGVVTATQVLATLRQVTPIERAVLMQPDVGDPPPVQRELVAMLDATTPIDRVARADFYAATRSDQLALVIATGDERWYANILLTIGAVPNLTGRANAEATSTSVADLVTADASGPGDVAGHGVATADAVSRQPAESPLKREVEA